MTKREYLEQYKQAATDFDSAVLRLAECRSRYEGIKAIVYSDMPKAHDSERDLSDALAAIEAETAKCSETCKRCLAIMERVQRSIDAVRDADERRVLRMRYMYGMKWEDIETTMHYTRQWLNRIRRKGIQNLRMVKNGD